MKKFKSFFFSALVFSIALITVHSAKAQDVCKLNPKYCTLLCDTAGVRMMHIILKPGEELVLHTHPVQEIYIIKGGQLTVDHKDGKPEVYDMKDGQHLQGPPEKPHTSKNTGTTTLDFILVEKK